MRLTVAACSHWEVASPRIIRVTHDALLSCLGRNLKNDDDDHTERQKHAGYSDAPIQVQMINTGTWFNFESWPPVDASPTKLFLTQNKHLGTGQLSWSQSPHQRIAPHTSYRNNKGGGSLSYVYDPRRPTPSRGGPSFNVLNSGRCWQLPIERRSDVIVLSTAPLAEDLHVVGNVSLVAFVRCEKKCSIDIVGRLCSVTSWGLSTNVCEGLTRVKQSEMMAAAEGEGGTGWWCKVTVELNPTAVTFIRGSRIRLQVCSGAHPRWMRNLGGSGELTDLHKEVLTPSAGPIRVELCTDSNHGSHLNISTLPVTIAG